MNPQNPSPSDLATPLRQSGPGATEQPPTDRHQHPREESNPQPQEVEDEDADPVGERQSGA